VSSNAPNVHALPGGRDKPDWAPAWAPSAGTLDYLQKVATIVLLALGVLYFLGIDQLKPFAKRHVAAVV
jgi:hypothetical protein